MKLLWTYALVLSMFFYFASAQAEEQSQPSATQQEAQPQALPVQKNWVAAISPQEGTEVIGKKPLIKIEFLEPVVTGALMVTLDSTDITQLLSLNDKGFEYKPVMVLPPGAHTINITATDKDGKQLQKTLSFKTRHTAPFEEAYTDNEATVIYEQVLKKPESAASVPNSKVEANLRSDTKVRNKEWQFTFNTNLRFMDQSLPVFTPLKKGIDAANWLFTSTYAGEKTNVKVSMGDVQVNETQYTVMGLARKGGVLNIEFGNYFLNAFSMKSAQEFGFRGVGISDDEDDHILGISGGARLLDRKVEFRTIYVSGGEQGSSFGISTVPATKRGDVLGFLLNTDLLENKLKTEFEVDFSKFDPDVTDEFGSKSDKAYKLKAGGFLGQYNYEAMYEYVGKNYEVVGNMGIPKDREGVTLRGGGAFGMHNVNLTLSRYNDNVRNDELFPRIVNYQGNMDYSFNGIQSLPMGINYQKSVQESTKEPAGANPLKIDTDTITGRVNYSAGVFGIGAQTAYSLMNDKTDTNNDTRTVTYTLTPSYNTPAVSTNLNLMLNRSKNSLSNFWMDTYTINLDLRTRFMKERASFDVSSTYNIMKADNGSVDSRNLNANFRLGYMIKEILRGFIRPTIAIRGTYMKNTDNINPAADSDAFALFLVLSTSTPFSF